MNREQRVSILLQCLSDTAGALEPLTVLDLGAAEGSISVAFARHCRHVTAIEGRIGNVEKAQLVKRALGIENLDVVHQDARDLDTTQRFDVVLCLGLLYHLEGEAGVKLCHDLAAITGRVAVVETHTHVGRRHQVFSAGDREYAGRWVREFDRSAGEEERERLSRSSVGNAQSFWFTQPSLFNLLSDAGFSSVMQVRTPHRRSTSDRVTLLCFKGPPRRAGQRWDETDFRGRPNPAASWWGGAKLRFAGYAPAALKRVVRNQRARRRLRGGAVKRWPARRLRGGAPRGR